MCLFNCTRGLDSEKPLAVNVLTSLKNSWNLQKSTLILLFHHSEQKSVWKSYFWSDATFQVCLITRWLPTTRILVVIERIYTYQFKSHYLKKHKLSFYIFFPFLEYKWNLPYSEKKRSLKGQVFLKLLSPKCLLI